MPHTRGFVPPPYPYDRLVHAEAPIRVDAAGSAGMVLYRESLYGGGPAEALVARETARQWFGLVDTVY